MLIFENKSHVTFAVPKSVSVLNPSHFQMEQYLEVVTLMLALGS